MSSILVCVVVLLIRVVVGKKVNYTNYFLDFKNVNSKSSSLLNDRKDFSFYVEEIVIVLIRHIVNHVFDKKGMVLLVVITIREEEISENI